VNEGAAVAPVSQEFILRIRYGTLPLTFWDGSTQALAAELNGLVCDLPNDDQAEAASW